MILPAWSTGCSAVSMTWAECRTEKCMITNQMVWWKLKDVRYCETRPYSVTMLSRPVDLTLLFLKRRVKQSNYRCGYWFTVGLYKRRLKRLISTKREIGKLWGIRRQEVVPVVVCALGAVSKSLDTWFDMLGIIIKTLSLLQKTAFLETVRILKKVLERWRRRNDPRDLWPLAKAPFLGVIRRHNIHLS